jgi:hypothetical protein
MGTTAQAGCFYLPSCPVKRWFSRSVPLARAATYGEARTDEPKTIIQKTNVSGMVVGN